MSTPIDIDDPNHGQYVRDNEPKSVPLVPVAPRQTPEQAARMAHNFETMNDSRQEPWLGRFGPAIIVAALLVVGSSIATKALSQAAFDAVWVGEGRME